MGSKHDQRNHRHTVHKATYKDIWNTESLFSRMRFFTVVLLSKRPSDTCVNYVSQTSREIADKRFD